MTVYYHPRALSWVTLSTPSSPAHPGTITGTPTYLVASPHNPDNCTCGRYTFVKKCSCIHASINIPCGRTRTPTSPAKFCGGKDVSLVPHHWVVDFVVSDECEDHPGYVLPPFSSCLVCRSEAPPHGVGGRGCNANSLGGGVASSSAPGLTRPRRPRPKPTTTAKPRGRPLCPSPRR